MKLNGIIHVRYFTIIIMKKNNSNT
jgi:hypothetical protein